MKTCSSCGASFEDELSACPECQAEFPTQETEPAQTSRQIPKQMPKQVPKQMPRESSVFVDTPQKEEVLAEDGRVIICPKCGSEEVYLMENRSPMEREKNVLMACTHCKRTFHGPAYYDSKIIGRKRGVVFFAATAALTAVGFVILLVTGQLTAFLPGTILGGAALLTSVAGVVLFGRKASYWKRLQAECYKASAKGGAKS